MTLLIVVAVSVVLSSAIICSLIKSNNKQPQKPTVYTMLAELLVII